MYSVLMIDDNQEEIEFLTVILEEEYEVTAACTGEEGVSRAAEGDYSLIFLSAALSGMEEFALLREIQGTVMPRHIPVILLFDSEDIKREERGLFLGAADYIIRPAYPIVIKTRARTHINLYQYERTAEQQLDMVDSLTGIASRERYELNRALKWQEAVRLNLPISICMIDLDKFRTYNERYGFPAGDKVLVSIAESVSSCLKRSTDFFARYSGEKFIVVIMGEDGKAVFEHLTRIRRTVEKLHIPHWDSVSRWVTVSIGAVTVVPKVGDSYDGYFEMAEHMLADAKQSGRNQVVWTDGEKEQLKG